MNKQWPDPVALLPGTGAVATRGPASVAPLMKGWRGALLRETRASCDHPRAPAPGAHGTCPAWLNPAGLTLGGRGVPRGLQLGGRAACGQPCYCLLRWPPGPLLVAPLPSKESATRFPERLCGSEVSKPISEKRTGRAGLGRVAPGGVAGLRVSHSHSRSTSPSVSGRSAEDEQGADWCWDGPADLFFRDPA